MKKIFTLLGALGALALYINTIYSHPPQTPTTSVSSSSFKNNQRLNKKHAYDQQNISPHLAWHSVKNAKSYALICADPDAPGKTWIHWVVFNIPATVTQLAQNAGSHPELLHGALQGKNDMGSNNYGGPCPPRGHGNHHYVFTIYALDTILNASSGITSQELEHLMAGHILAQGKIIGIYSRT